MNYQPLFDLMSQHGLTLLEGEMEEIIRAVNEGQGTPTDTNKYDPALYWVMGNHGDVPPQVTPKQKKLTYLEFERLANISPSYPDLYDAIFHYLADEQPAVEPTYIPNESVEEFNKRIGKHLDSLPTKPELSRLEVAASAINTASQYVKDITAKDVLNILGIPRGTKYVTEEHFPKCVSRVAILIADELIKQAKG